MDWQLVTGYFTVKSTDIFCSVAFFSYNQKAIILIQTRKRGESLEVDFMSSQY